MKPILKVNVFSGFEETYQAWNGVPSVKLNNDLEGMKRYEEHWLYSSRETSEMIQSDKRTYNLYTYENQVDHYQQDHYQLHFSHKINQAWNINASAHYTYGRGYYENFKEDEDLADYQLSNIMVGTELIETTNMVNRKWLDNDFYGFTYSLNYNENKSSFTLGGGFNVYDGNHFGNVIWSTISTTFDTPFTYYQNSSIKNDGNIYSKATYDLNPIFSLYGDLQYRHVYYDFLGIDNEGSDLQQSIDLNFFNPKAGINAQLDPQNRVFLSTSVNL